MEATVKCPSCGHNSLRLSDYLYDMPLVGKVILTVGKCDKCGYKFNDVRLAEQKPPRRLKVLVESEKDLNIIVVRCSTATIRVPELGLELIPGPASEGFITTIEGVLRRFLDVLETLCKDAEPKLLAECTRRRRELEEALKGNKRFTLIIEDPEGGSAILSDKAVEEPLT